VPPRGPRPHRGWAASPHPVSRKRGLPVNEKDPEQDQGPENHTLVELCQQPEVERRQYECLAQPDLPRAEVGRLLIAQEEDVTQERHRRGEQDAEEEGVVLESIELNLDAYQ